MSFDAHANLAVSTVAVSPGVAGLSLDVAAGHGVRFPAAPFNCTIWPAAESPDPTNAEVVRVTAVVGDTLTIDRAQEASTARSVIAGDKIAATITAKTITDIEGSGLGLPLSNSRDNDPHSVDLSTALTVSTATPGAYPDALLN